MQLSDSDMETIERVRRLIEANIFHRITLKELCKHSEFGMSKLTKAFKSRYKVSIAQYHLIISMEYGKALLEDGKQVKAVAILLEYKTVGHFARAFSKVFKQSPKTFKVQQ